jgi:hypothetical protein
MVAGAAYLEVVLAGLEDPGGAEEHGHMRVVPARVHLPGVPALVLPLHGLLKQSKARERVVSQPGSAVPNLGRQLAVRAISSSEKKVAFGAEPAAAEHA